MGKYLVSGFLSSLKSLENWFEKQQRILPWRDHPEVYRVWVSEIMLQQTQVSTVIPYFERFLARFPTVEALAQAPVEEVLLFWSGLGYYSRARNLHRGAQKIVAQGRFPMSRDEWLEIPGVGEYTAGAILSIAGNLPEPILDGNVERVLSRVRAVKRTPQGDGAFKKRLWKLSEIFVKTANLHGIRPSALNQALMELGAMVCTPKNPRCLLCPLQGLCRARREGSPESYPPRKTPKKWVSVAERLHCVSDELGRVLLRKRKPGEWRAGLWDFLEEDFLERISSERNLLSELNHRKEQLRFLGTIETRHIVTRHKIQRSTQVWISAKNSWTATNNDDLKWISIRNPEVALGSAVKKSFQAILERYPEVTELRNCQK